jgi:hypothetical protein
MKTNYKILIVAIAVVSIAACVKAPHGFLSTQIRYRDSPIQVQRGVTVQTTAVDNDGSSAPVSYQLLDIRDVVTHKHADSIYKNRPRYIYTGIFDPKTDTTVALLNTKRKLVNLPCFEFNEHTGGFTFYGTTVDVPLGRYEFDIKATNENGTKTYNNVGLLNMYDGDPENDGPGDTWFQDNSSASGDLGAPTVTITKLSKLNTLAILEYVDKNGVPFNPKKKEYITRGDRTSLVSFAAFHPLIVSDTSLTCNYEIAPFPFQPDPSLGLNIYYRIPSNIALIDPGFTPTPARIYSVNPRISIRLFETGTYLIKVKLQHVTRSPL